MVCLLAHPSGMNFFSLEIVTMKKSANKIWGNVVRTLRAFCALLDHSIHEFIA